MLHTQVLLLPIQLNTGWSRSRHVSKRDKRMLKITKVATSNEEITLQLDGRVTGQWIELLRDSAESVLEEEMRLSLDLKNICFIDCEGLAESRNNSIHWPV